jgi:chromosome partitioning protein
VFHVKPRVLAVANQKGGVGKTTTVINLGASLAVYEQPTLLVDLDPQSNCTSGVGHEPGDSDPTSYRLLAGDLPEGQPPYCRTGFPYLDLLPSTADLAGAEVELVGMVGREFRLRDALASFRDHRFVLIDCPPSLGLLTINALAAADAVLIPIQCEYFALEGVSELMRTIEEVRRYLNPALSIDAVLLTMYDERTNLGQQVADEVRRVFGDIVQSSLIPRNVRLAEAPSYGLPVHAYDLRCRGAQAYLAVGRDFLRRQEAHGAA